MACRSFSFSRIANKFLLSELASSSSLRPILPCSAKREKENTFHGNSPTTYQQCLNNKDRYWSAREGEGRGGQTWKQTELPSPPVSPSLETHLFTCLSCIMSSRRQRLSGPRGGPKSTWISERSIFSLKRQPSCFTKQSNSFTQLIEIDLANARTQFGSLNSFCSFDLA